MSNILPNPQSGSADPSASLPALWCYIQPALDHIIRSPTNNLSKVPAVDINYHMGIHTALYNYFTNRAVAAPPPPPPPSPPSHLVKGTSVPIPPPHHRRHEVPLPCIRQDRKSTTGWTHTSQTWRERCFSVPRWTTQRSRSTSCPASSATRPGRGPSIARWTI